MGWTLGSESREQSGTNALPDGIGHAVVPNDQLTACGRPFRSLYVWPEIPWCRVGMLGLARCPTCEAEVGPD